MIPDTMARGTRATIEALRTSTEHRMLFVAAQHLETLLQLAGIAGTKPQDDFNVLDRKEALRFWCLILGMSGREPDKLVFDGARAYHAVVWAAAHQVPLPETKLQAGEYLIHANEACQVHLEGGYKALPKPGPESAPAPAKARGHLRLVDANTQ